MRFAPHGRTLGEAMIGGLILVLLLICCWLLARNGSRGLLLSCVGLGLTGLAWAYTRFLSGAWPEVEALLTRLICWRPRRGQSTIRSNTRDWECSVAVAVKLRYLEERVNELSRLEVARRLADFESQEAWRTQWEWLELRDVWKTLVADMDTPEEVRRACREWLAKYPEALDFFARRLMDMGLLRERELPDDWEEQEVRKNRIQ